MRTIIEHVTDVTPLLEMSAGQYGALFHHENHNRTCYRCYSSIRIVSRPLWCLILPMRTTIEHVTDVTPLLEISAGQYGALFHP